MNKNKIMRNWHLLLFLFFIIGCNEDEQEQEYNEIKIERHYPYSCRTKILDEIDKDTLELFKDNLFLINSIAELYESPLFCYCSEKLKEELSKCDFAQCTLIITTSSTIYEVTDIKSCFGYYTFFSEYVYEQTLYCKSLVDENIYLIIDIFSVKKILDDSKLTYAKVIELN